MAGAVKTITFVDRQEDIPSCVIVNLKFTAGDLRAEYISGTEEEDEDGNWSYEFLVQEEDLPGAMTLDDVVSGGIIEPLWSCLADDEAVEEETDCLTRWISCFQGLPTIEEFEEGDMVAVLRYDAECDIYCLVMMDPTTFKEQLELLS